MNIVPEMVLRAALRLDLRSVHIIQTYREVRERLASEERQRFDPALVAEVADACQSSVAKVKAVTNEWLQHRPLKFLRKCRYAGVDAFFDMVRRSGRRI